MGESNIKMMREGMDKKVDQMQYAQKSLNDSFVQDDFLAGAGQWDAEVKALLDNYTLKSLFLTEDWVFIILDLLAQEISNVDMKVFDEVVVEGTMQIVADDSHPLNALFKDPNPLQEYSTWMYLHVIEYCLMGNGIQWFSENLNQLHILPAEDVLVDVDDKTRKLKNYIVISQSGNFQSQNDMVSFPVDEIIHQRRPNPISNFWGLSPFIPNSKSLLFNRYSQDYLNAFYLKQATGQLALKLDKQVSEEAALRLMRSFEASYTGRKNTRRTMLLPKGVDVEKISTSIVDQNLIEVINQNQEKIINILRIPKHALSLAEAGSLGSEEHKMALRFMWTSAILPVMKKISGTFGKFFREKGLLEEGKVIRFDLSQVEILREDALRLASLSVKQLEFKTLNEVRKDLHSLPPLDGGDVTPGKKDELTEEPENRPSNPEPSREVDRDADPRIVSWSSHYKIDND